ncbi:MAG: secretin N-terminal domain-containing protein [Verrucomicrobiota bacterium]
MKLKEIGTIVIAGALSLAAIFIMETERPFPESAALVNQSAATFEDDSRIFEPSLPNPSAEPPAGGSVYDPEDQGRAVDIPVDALAAPTVEVIEEPILTEDEIFESASPSLDDSSSLAGIEDPTETIPTFDDTFADAISEATGEEEMTTSPASTPVANTANGDEPASIIEETPTGFWLREARLNDVFQHLAQLANRQFFHNADLNGPSYVVTGQLMNDDPVRQMEELALMYGVTIHTKGNTVYALTNAQLSTLPTEPFRYQLKYLRPSDIEQIKLILQPFLTPGSGIIEYETKTNTLIVMDNERKLDALAIFLEQIDQPKQQIAIETRILRITSSSRNQIGVDWSSVLGEQGLSIGATTGLNSIFNLPELDTVERILTSTGTGNSLQVVQNNRTFTETVTQTTNSDDSNLVLSPLQVNAVLRALNAGGLAQQESSPTLIAEDNEEGLISIIDRIPIITATVSETTAGQNVTEEVRYVIDTADPVGDPSTTREIGVSVAVTPTILPDNTIRMALRPRSAQVVEFVQGQNGNSYPRVNESTVTTTARVPNGHSLLIGGFYEETQQDQTNKVPVLGDIPAVNLLFKSTDKQKEHTSLVFIVTPRLYRPSVPGENDLISHEIHDAHILPNDHDYPDPEHPGHSYRSDLRNTTNNIFNKYEPDAPSNLLHPQHPYNAPESLPTHGKVESEVPYFENPSVTVRAVDQTQKKNGFFGKVFGGNKGN